MRRKVRTPKRKGILARLYDAPPSPGDARFHRQTTLFKTLRQAYTWAQKELAITKFKHAEVVLFRQVDVVHRNTGSCKARRVFD